MSTQGTDVLRSLFESMAEQGLAHFKKTRPVMQLTEQGYVPTGAVEPVWEAKDVSAFTGLLKLADYKHVDGMSAAPSQLRDDLAEKRKKRDAHRDKAAAKVEANGAPHISIPPINIEV